MSFKAFVSTFSQTLGRVDGLLAAPYGYTVSLWTAGAAASVHFGLPGPGEILSFATGAVGAFLLLGYWGRKHLDREVPGHVPSVIVANGVALIAAVVVSLVCTLLPWPLAGFGASGFTVTLTYGLSLAAFLTFAPQVLHRPQPAGMTPPPKESPVWLFDLDNTLYPSNAGLMAAISARISRYLEHRLNLSPALAEAIRETYYERYGSSVSGVLRHCQVDAVEFLNFIHDLPVEHYLSPDPRLADLLASLPGYKYLFTNAPAGYARRALRTLGVEGYFDGIFDLHFGGLVGKPSPVVYEKVLTALGHPAGACWFVEDSLANLLPARAFGCRTVWITPDGATPPAYVEHVIGELAELEKIAQTRATPGRTGGKG